MRAMEEKVAKYVRHQCEELENAQEDYVSVSIYKEDVDKPWLLSISYDEGGAGSLVHFCPYCGTKLESMTHD
jgi:hypothetical protein